MIGRRAKGADIAYMSGRFGVQGLAVQKSAAASSEAAGSVSLWAMYCDLMKRCWQREPATRPTFKQIQDELEGMLSAVKDGLRSAAPRDAAVVREQTVPQEQQLGAPPATR